MELGKNVYGTPTVQPICGSHYQPAPACTGSLPACWQQPKAVCVPYAGVQACTADVGLCWRLIVVGLRPCVSRGGRPRLIVVSESASWGAAGEHQLIR